MVKFESEVYSLREEVDRIDVTIDMKRKYLPGIKHYFVNDQEVTYEVYMRIWKEFNE